MDEVICGFGRLGHWFGSERFGIRPDLITFAKGVTSGYIPVGGVVVGAAVRAPLESDPTFMLRHGHTYSGHAAAAAGALAALDVTASDGLLDRAKHVGARLADGLRSLADDGIVAEVRGDVAVWAVGLKPEHDGTAVRDRMLELGVITRAIGTDTLSFCPPLVITDDEIDRVVDAVATAVR
jgi:adenosylmethionine-8-amino-7-oxononanoate aminotransferase